MSNRLGLWQADPVLAADTEVGETPVWLSGSNELLFTDITRRRLHRWHLDTDVHETFEVPEQTGAAWPRQHGGFVLATPSGLSTWDGSGAPQHRQDIEAELPDNRMNDAGTDPAGRLWAGTMAYSQVAGQAALYRIDGDWNVGCIQSGIGLSNGLGWSPDGRRMYWVDSLQPGVWAFDYDCDNGTPSRKSLLIDTSDSPGMPDGLAVDADGLLWLARFGAGRIERYTAAGDLVGAIDVPVPQVTSCCFGGRTLSSLFITTATIAMTPDKRARHRHAGDIFRADTGAEGLARAAFAG